MICNRKIPLCPGLINIHDLSKLCADGAQICLYSTEQIRKSKIATLLQVMENLSNNLELVPAIATGVVTF